MAVLWEREAATADEVRDRLAGAPHDSTVRTLLRILVTKGYVKRRAKSRPAVYLPAVGRDHVQKKATRGLLNRLFGGSAESLILRLLEDEHLTPEQLRRLQETYCPRPQKKKPEAPR